MSLYADCDLVCWDLPLEGQEKEFRKGESPCVNLRDLASACKEEDPCQLEIGMAFRSSVCYNAHAVDKMRLKTIVDLADETYDVHPAIVEAQQRGQDINYYRRDVFQGAVRDKLTQLIPTTTKLKLGGESVCCQERYHQDLAEFVFTAETLDNQIKKPVVEEMYKFVLVDGHVLLAEILRFYANLDNYPILVNCNHGKDRTGVVTAVLLLAAGCDEETVLDDYERSTKELLGAREGGMFRGYEQFLPAWACDDKLVTVKREWMKNALDEVKKRYESFDNYFRTCLRLSESELDHIKINLNKKSKLSHYSKSVRDVGLIKRLTAENEKLNAENEKLKKELEEVTKKR